MSIIEVFEYNKSHKSELKEICASLMNAGFSGFFYHKIHLKDKHISSLSTSMKYLEHWYDTILPSEEYKSTISKTVLEEHCKLIIRINQDNTQRFIMSNFDLSCDKEFIENWGVLHAKDGLEGINLYLSKESICRKFLLLFRHRAKTLSKCEDADVFFDFDLKFAEAEADDKLSVLPPKTEEKYTICCKVGPVTLTSRQAQILGCLSKNLSLKEIGKLLGLTVNGVAFHIEALKNKSCCTYKSQLIDIARKNFLHKLQL